MVGSTQTPGSAPIGLHLTRVARAVSRAFDHALAEAGGSLPMWLVLLNLQINPTANQRELADAVGVREPTLTQHLNAMEKEGLLTRRRDPTNRRIHIVELTKTGEDLFVALRDAAISFDRQLRQGLPPTDLNRLEFLLNRLADNAGTSSEGPPWAGLAEPAPRPRPTSGQQKRPRPNL